MLGTDESHSIHERQATTVILEEDASKNADQLDLLQKPLKASYQVEESGSYKLETHETSSYQIIDDNGNQIKIDEPDSDTDFTRRSRTTSRAISINSISEDDVNLPSNYKTCELSVNEYTKNIPLDDGYAEMKITRIVMEEQEVQTAEIDEHDEDRLDSDESKKPDRDVQGEIEEKARRLYAELGDEEGSSNRSRKVSYDRQSSGKSALYDIEEKGEPNLDDLSPEEIRQLRIKEIRANARRASLQKAGDSIDKTDTEENEPFEEAKSADFSRPPNGKPPNGKRQSIDDTDDVPRDAYTETLLKHAQRQRSVLEDIIDQKERSLSRSRETSRQRSVLSESRRGSVAPREEANRLERTESNENRPNFKTDLDDCEVKEGEPFRLEVKVLGEPQPELVWLHDGVEVKPDGYHVKIEQQIDGKASLAINRGEPDDSGEYQVVATNEHGSASSCAEVKVIERHEPREKRPFFVDYVDSCRAVEGFPIKLSARVSGHPKPEIEWFHDGKNISPDDEHINIINRPDGTTTCIIDSVEMEDKGEYKVVATNDLGKAFTSGYLSISPKTTGREPRKDRPEFVAELHNETINEGQPLDLHVKIAAHPEPEVKWLHNGEEIIPEENRHVKITQKPDGTSALHINECTMKDGGEYIAIAANEIGSVSSKAKVSVVQQTAEYDTFESKPKFAVKLEDQVVQKGESLGLKVKVDSSPKADLKWLHDGEEIKIDSDDRVRTVTKPDGSAALLLDRVTDADAGEYVVVATNEFGSASTRAEVAVAPETVEERPAVEAQPVFIKKLDDQTVQQGSYLGLKVRVNAHPQPELVWTRDNKEIDLGDKRVHLKQQSEGTIELTIDDVQPTDGGEYKVVAKNTHGTATTQAQIKVVKETVEVQSVEPSKPVFVTKLEDQNIQQGSSLGLKVKVRAYPNEDLQWLRDGEKINAEGDDRIKITRGPDGTSTLTIDDVRPEDSGIYSAVASNESGTTKSSAYVAVAEPLPCRPKFDTRLRDLEVPSGAPVKLEVKVCGYPKPKLEWYHDDKVICPDDDSLTIIQRPDGVTTLEIANANIKNTGLYKVTASSRYGTAESEAELTVLVKPEIEKELVDVKVVEGEDVRFVVNVTGNPTPVVKWLHNGEDVKTDRELRDRVEVKKNKDGSSTLLIEKVEEGDVGEIKFVAKNEIGSASTKADLLVTKETARKVDVKPAKPIFELPLKDQNVQQGSSLRLKVKVRAYPNTDIKWLHNGEEIDAENDDKITVTQSPDGSSTLTIDDAQPSDSGEYTAVATNDAGQTKTSSYVDVVEPSPSRPKFESELKDIKVPKGETVKLEVKISGFPKPRIQWFRDEDEISPFDNEFTITQKPDGTATLEIASVDLTHSGLYRVAAANQYGVADSEAQLTVQVKPELEKELIDVEVAEMESPRFEIKVIGSPTPKLKWLRDGKDITADEGLKQRIKTSQNRDGTAVLVIEKAKEADTGEIQVVAENEAGIVSSKASLIVTKEVAEVGQVEPALPVFVTKLEDQNIQQGSSLGLKVKVRAYPNEGIKWLHDGKEIEADTDDKIKITQHPDGTSTLVIDDAQPDDSGQYTAVVSNSVGTAKTTAYVDVAEPLPSKPKFDQELIDQNVVKDSEVRLEVKVSGHPKPKIQWYHDEEEVLPTDGVTITQKPDGTYALDIASASLSHSGSYKVKASNKYGVAESEAELNVLIRPEIEKELIDVKLVEGQDARFEVKVIGNPRPELHWLHNDEDIETNGKIIRRVTIKENSDGSESLVIEHVKMSDAGNFKVIATNPLGSASSQSALLVTKDTAKYVEQEPSIPIFETKLEDQKVQKGSSLGLKVKVRAYPNSEIQWYHDGEKLYTDKDDRVVVARFPDGTSTVVIDDAQPEDAGQYVAVASNAAGTAESSANVVVLEPSSFPPVFETDLKDLKVVEGSPVTLKVKVSGTPKPKIEWYHDEKPVDVNGEVTITQKPDGVVNLDIANVSFIHAGKYKAVASNKYGVAESSAKLTVLVKPSFEKELVGVEVAESVKVRFEVKVCGAPQPGLKWLHNGQVLQDDGYYVKISEVEEDGRATLIISKATLVDSGDYRVVATNEAGSAASNAILSVTTKRESRRGEKPAFDSELEDQIVKENEPISLEAKVSGSPQPKLKWFRDGQELKPSNRIKITENPEGTVALEITKAKPSDAGDYRLVATNDAGSVASNAVVSVRIKPKILRQLSDQEIEDRSPLELTVKAEGIPEPQIKWLHNGEDIIPDGKNVTVRNNLDGSTSLIIDKVRPEDGGEYEAVASNPEGSASSAADVAVVPRNIGEKQRPEIVSKLSDLTVDEGSPISLKVKVQAYPQADIKWYHKGNEIIPDGERIIASQSPDGTAVLTIADAELDDAGDYRVVATNELGADACKGELTVNRVPGRGKKPIFLMPLLPTKAEIGSLVKLSVKVSGTPEPTVKWLHMGKEIKPSPGYVRMSEYPDGTATLVISDAQPENAGEYTAVATNSVGSASSSGPLFVSSKPSILKGLKDEKVTEDEPVKLEFKFDGFPEPEIKWTHDGEVLSDDGFNVVITQSSDGTASLELKSAQLSDAGEYQATVSNPAGKVATRARLGVAQKKEEKKVVPPVFVVGLEDTIANAGTTVKLEIETAGSPLPSLKWYHNGKPIHPQRGLIRIDENPDGTAILQLNEVKAADAGEYQVVAKNPHGEITSKGTLSVVSMPSIVSDLKDTEVEKGKPVSFEAQVEGLPHPSIKWLRNGKELIPDGKHIISTLGPDGLALLQLDSADISDAGEYRLIATNPFGSATSSALLSVSAPLSKDGDRPSFIEGLHNRTVEVGSPVKVDVVVSGSPSPTLKWLLNGREIESSSALITQTAEGKASLSINKASPSIAGDYRVIATNEFGTASTEAALTVVSKPKIERGLEDDEVDEDKPIKLTVKISGFPSPRVRWFQNGEELRPDGKFLKCSSEPDGTHSLEISKASIEDGGEYRVTATNDLGSDQSTAVLTVTSKRDAVLRHGEKPVFLVPLKDTEIDIDSTAQLEVQVSGVPLPTLKWLHNGKEIIPQKGCVHINESPDGKASVVIKASALADAGQYRVIATNESGTAACSGELSVLSKPIFIGGLRHQYVKEGVPVEFEVKITGFPQPEVTWLYNDVEINPDDEYAKISSLPDGTHTLSFDAVSLDDAGNYSIEAVNKYGQNSSSAILAVTPNEDYSSQYGEKPEFVKTLQDVTVNEGFPIKLEVKVTGKPLPEIQWFCNEKPVKAVPGYKRVSENPDGTAYLVLHEAAAGDGGTYRVVATNEMGSAECTGELTMLSKNELAGAAIPKDYSKEELESGAPGR